MDSLVQWFTANLSGVISKEAIIFIISMIPILELRGGLLAASPALLNVPILRAIPICIVGNILPIPFILLLIRHVLEWMKKVPCFRGIALWLERKAMSKKGHNAIQHLGIGRNIPEPLVREQHLRNSIECE